MAIMADMYFKSRHTGARDADRLSRMVIDAACLEYPRHSDEAQQTLKAK